MIRQGPLFSVEQRTIRDRNEASLAEFVDRRHFALFCAFATSNNAVEYSFKIIDSGKERLAVN